MKVTVRPEIGIKAWRQKSGVKVKRGTIQPKLNAVVFHRSGMKNYTAAEHEERTIADCAKWYQINYNYTRKLINVIMKFTTDGVIFGLKYLGKGILPRFVESMYWLWATRKACCTKWRPDI